MTQLTKKTVIVAEKRQVCRYVYCESHHEVTCDSHPLFIFILRLVHCIHPPLKSQEASEALHWLGSHVGSAEPPSWNTEDIHVNHNTSARVHHALSNTFTLRILLTLSSKATREICNARHTSSSMIIQLPFS